MKQIKVLFSIVWKISPGYFFLVIFGSIISSFSIFGNVIFPKFLIDELTGGQDLKKLIFLGSLIVVWNFVFAFINKTYQRVLSVKEQYVNKKMTEVMAEKIMNIDYQYLEDPYYLDLKERAVFANSNQSSAYQIINNFSGAVSSLITIIGLITIMLTLGFVLIAILAVGISLVIITTMLFKKYLVQVQESIIPINRVYGYYINKCFDSKLAKDVRIYNMNPIFNKSIVGANKKMNDEFGKFYRTKKTIIDGIEQIIVAIQTGLIYLYVSFRYFSERFGPKITLGDFTMYSASAINFATTANRFFKQIIEITKYLSYLKPFTEFMQLPEEKYITGKIEAKSFESLEFVGLTFKYPKTQEEVLQNINFTIRKGEKVSIVGLNGAGKTTLIKLICRLYKPTKGSILYNGVDIFDYDYNSYVSRIAAVFQDYRLFAYSISENIVCNEKLENEKLSKIIEQVDLTKKIKELPLGLSSRLNKEYNEEGVELSGGQEQKIAISRALYKQADLVILDEPTSALDPLAEADIYQNFNELVLSKTAIYISHRMSSSVFCDKVLIIDKGTIADFDTHQNLMKKIDSLYYKLFTTQAKNYRIDTDE